MLSRCRQCESVFNRVGAGELCPQCAEELARLRRVVEDYLAYYPSRDPATIAEATKVPRGLVEQFLAATTLEEAAPAGGARPVCVRCGAAPAEVGPRCGRCALALRREVQAAALTTDPDPTPVADDGRRRRKSFRGARYRYERKQG